MRARKLLVVSLAAFGVVALPATAAHALQVKVSINFGPTLIGPDNGTLIVTANPGDSAPHHVGARHRHRHRRYHGLVFGVEGVSGVDTTEISRVVGSALELTGQGFDPGGNPNAPFLGEFGYFASSDGAPDRLRRERR